MQGPHPCCNALHRKTVVEEDLHVHEGGVADEPGWVTVSLVCADTTVDVRCVLLVT